MNFEDLHPIPCNDAGLPGNGGSSAPCAFFTPTTAERRLWPPVAVEALRRFRERPADAPAKSATTLQPAVSAERVCDAQ